MNTIQYHYNTLLYAKEFQKADEEFLNYFCGNKLTM